MRAVRGPGENLDDAGQGIRAPDRGPRATYDLDTLDQRQRQMGEIEQTLRCGVDADAVNQDQRVVGIAAADENRVLGAAAAGADHVDAGLLAKQVNHIDGAAGLNVGAFEHGDTVAGIAGSLRDAVAGDLHTVEIVGCIIGGCLQREQKGGG